jgi:hypothetical protein
MAVREKYPNAFDANSIDAQKAGMEMLVKCIEDRNFEEEDGTKTAINIEALYRFSDADLLKLMEIITPIQEKKS